jgi:hypothetical protein
MLSRSHFVCLQRKRFVCSYVRTHFWLPDRYFEIETLALGAVTDGKFMQTHSKDLIGFGSLVSANHCAKSQTPARCVRVRKLLRAFRKLSNLKDLESVIFSFEFQILSHGECMFFWHSAARNSSTLKGVVRSTTSKIKPVNLLQGLFQKKFISGPKNYVFNTYKTKKDNCKDNFRI